MSITVNSVPRWRSSLSSLFGSTIVNHEQELIHPNDVARLDLIHAGLDNRYTQPPRILFTSFHDGFLPFERIKLLRTIKCQGPHNKIRILLGRTFFKVVTVSHISFVYSLRTILVTNRRQCKSGQLFNHKLRHELKTNVEILWNLFSPVFDFVHYQIPV